MSFSVFFTHEPPPELPHAETWVRETFERIGWPLKPQAIGAFASYLRLLVKWNRHLNLTAIREPRCAVRRHFLDSALVLDHAPLRERDQVADIGSGAGFPGIPVAILRPDVQVTLWEPTLKKASFLETVRVTLGLKNVAVVPERLKPKRIPKPYLSAFDGVLSRYTAPLGWLAACAREMVRPGGWLVAHQWSGAHEEAEWKRLAETLHAAEAKWLPDPRAESKRCFALLRFSEKRNVEPESPSSVK